MYHEDIFGVTLRTKEVQTKLRASRRAKVFVTGADNKLIPADSNGEAESPTETAGKVNGLTDRNHSNVKSFEDVRLQAVGETRKRIVVLVMHNLNPYFLNFQPCLSLH